jgi:alkyl hydroperoxide reductase subunit AhpC
LLVEEKGPELRGSFIIDPDGVSRFAGVHDDNSARNTDEMPRVLPAP